ncbi:MAG: alanine--tRNA ligase [Elusimicrobiales bacterium]|nr:alanine--tRNA ligase [Elusimicrobiales bacterium]
MDHNKIRDKFLNFFKYRDHPIIQSSPLIPQGDPTLLFTSAGMVQFKPYYLGLKTDLKRATSCQKCFRTTDIDNVGKTIRHLTFFEMLGNFSFGDYFKEESLKWGYEFLVSEMSIDPSRLWFSYYRGGIAPKDEEVFEIWKRILPKNLHSHIFELGEDNFWSMGDTGPSGPCSEIYYDRGEQYHKNCPGPWCGCDRYIEIWNHVFTQFDRQVDGSFKPLPTKNIDTGMGLERLCFIIENKFSPFETTLFFPIIEDFIKYAYNSFSSSTKKIVDIILNNFSSEELYYKNLTDINAFDNFIPALRIIADHLRGSCFLISEGVIPSNEGRGYILRRLLRRAQRYAIIVGVKEPCLYRLVESVGKIYNNVYNQINQSLNYIKDIIEVEEKGFIEMIEKGEKYIESLLNKGYISGKDAFWIYETYGFPYELIKEIAGKRGINISDEEFEKAKAKAKEISRKWSSQTKDYNFLQKIDFKLPITKFVGYNKLEHESKVLAIIDLSGREHNEFDKGECFLVFDETPFYAESGGQVADVGILLKDNEICAHIKDVQKPFGDIFYHLVSVTKKVIKGEKYVLQVDSFRRKKISAHHTATHIINAALKKVFGNNVAQAGSLVNDEKFRFDYTLPKAPSYDDIKKIEEIANNVILSGLKIYKDERPLSDATNFGAILLPGEKYTDPARFILINRDGFNNVYDRFSLELCGGTHVDDLRDVFSIKIIRESSISRGIRRIEGIAGYALLSYLQSKEKKLEDLCNILDSEESDLINKALKLKNEIKFLEDKIKAISFVPSLEDIFEINSQKVVMIKMNNSDVKTLRNIADIKKTQHKSSLIFVYNLVGNKISFVFTKTSDLGISVKGIFNKLREKYSLNGGGREDFVQGGGVILDIEEFKKGIIDNVK